MKTIAFAEKRFFEWHEDEIAVSVRASSGSYGGGSEVLIVQEHTTHPDGTPTNISLPASMGMGGGYVPMVVSDKEPIAVEDDITIKIDDSGVSYSIRAREHKGAQCVVVCGKE